MKIAFGNEKQQEDHLLKNSTIYRAIIQPRLVKEWSYLRFSGIPLKRLGTNQQYFHGQNLSIWFEFQTKNSSHLNFNERTKWPYITLELSKPKFQRRRRSLECDIGTTSCCRSSLIVEFKDIGWDSWIVRPKLFNAYQCKGSCDQFIPNSRTDILKRAAKARNPKSKLGFCCSGSKFEGLPLLYFSEENGVKNLYSKTVKGIVVKQCGCS